jgi:hypothetical protein
MTQLQDAAPTGAWTDPPATATPATPPTVQPPHQSKAWLAAAGDLGDAKAALIDSLAAIAPLANHANARVVVGQLNDLINAVEGLADWMDDPEAPAQ